MSRKIYDYEEADALPPNSPGTGGMVQAARQALCNAYHKHPQAFLPLFSDSPVGQAYQMLWDKVCPIPQRPPSQPVPRPLPPGSQCPIFYKVGGEIRVPNDSSFPSPSMFLVNIRGPLIGVVTEAMGDSVGWYIQGSGSSNPRDDRQFVFSTSGSSLKGVSVIITSVVPDQAIPPGGCENIPSPRQYDQDYPDLNDFVIPGGALSPVPGPNPPAGPIVVRPLPRFPVPIPRPFAPFVQVDVGPFNFQFDLGGVHFNLKPDIDINIQPNIDINIRLPPGGSSGGGGTVIELPEDCGCSDQFKEISEKINSLRPKFMSRSQQTLAANSTGGNAQLPRGHVAVLFTVVERPENTKAMFGSGGPDVWFAGWFSFSNGLGQGGSRQPLDYLATQQFSPVEATHINWTVKKGFRVDVQVFTRTPPSEGTWERGDRLYWQV